MNAVTDGTVTGESQTDELRAQLENLAEENRALI